MKNTILFYRLLLFASVFLSLTDIQGFTGQEKTILPDSIQYQKSTGQMENDSLTIHPKTIAPDSSLFQKTRLQRWTKFSVILENRDDLKYKSLGDLLRHLPGVWIRDTGTPDQWASLLVRGGTEQQMVLLLDGNPITDPWTGVSDLNLIPIDYIARLEYYPSVNPFGISSIGGVINVIPQNVQTDDPFTKVIHRTGSHDFSDVDVTFAQKLTPKLEIISGALLRKYGETLANQSFEGQKIRSTITCRPFEDLRFQYAILQNWKSLDQPYYPPVIDDSTTLTSHIDLKRYDHAFKADWVTGAVQTSLKISHSSLLYKLKTATFYPKEKLPVRSTNVRFGQTFQSLHWPISWSLETTQAQIRDTTNTTHSHQLFSGHLTGCFSLNPTCHFIPDLSYQQATDKSVYFLFSGQFHWQIGRITLQTGYTESIRHPTLAERYGLAGSPSIPYSGYTLAGIPPGTPVLENTSLHPETSTGLNASIGFESVQHYRINVTGYHRRVQDRIAGYQTEDGYRFINADAIDVTGVESSLYLTFFRDFHLNATLNWQETTGRRNEQPAFSGFNALNWDRSFFQSDLRINMMLSHQIWSGYDLFTEEAGEGGTASVESGSLLNFKITLTFTKLASLTYEMQNILGLKIHRLPYFAQPRNFSYFGISWDLFN